MDRAETIDETAALIEKAGGRATAIRVDHTHEEEVKSLAARVRSEAGRLDVLVNSIWGADPMIDWAKRFWEIDLGRVHAYLDQTLVSHIITNRHLAPLMVAANRGLIVEVIDGHFAGFFLFEPIRVDTSHGADERGFAMIDMPGSTYNMHSRGL